MKILLTGFDPFGGETVNPAFEAVKLLPDTIAGAEIVKQEVPTEFIRAGEVLEAAIQANQPDVVICIGQAGGRSAITPEKVAINLMDGRIADNAGYQPESPCRAKSPMRTAKRLSAPTFWKKAPGPEASPMQTETSHCR